MGDCRQTCKPAQYVTSHPGQLSLAIRPWVGTLSASESWGVNRHTAWCTSLVCVVWQCTLMSGWGLRKRRSLLPRGPYDLGGILLLLLLAFDICFFSDVWLELSSSELRVISCCVWVVVRHEWNFNCLQWNKHSLLTYLGPVAGMFTDALLQINKIYDKQNFITEGISQYFAFSHISYFLYLPLYHFLFGPFLNSFRGWGMLSVLSVGLVVTTRPWNIFWSSKKTYCHKYIKFWCAGISWLSLVLSTRLLSYWGFSYCCCRCGNCFFSV